MLTSLYGHYDDSAVKRNLNHRTWNGIKSRANRLKLKSRKRVLRERKLAQKEFVRDKIREGIEKKNLCLKDIRVEMEKVRAVSQDSGDVALKASIKKLADVFKSHGFAIDGDFEGNAIKFIDAVKAMPKTWSDKLAKIQVELAVKEAAEKVRKENRGVSTLPPITRTLAQRIGDIYNIERMRTTTDVREFDRLEARYGKRPWLPDSEWAIADKAFMDSLASKVPDARDVRAKAPPYPGPWKDKVVTKPPLRDPLTIPWNASVLKLMKAQHDSLVAHGVTMPDISLDEGAFPHLKYPLPKGGALFAAGNENSPRKSPCLLAGTRVYLCGAMDRVADHGVGWRKELTPRLKELGVVLFDPTNKPFYDGKGDESDSEIRKNWVRDGEYDKVREFMKDVRGGDLRMVNNCDFVIIYVDANVHMCGSYEEIAIATHEKKPILVVCEQGKTGTPWWLFGQIPHEHIFSTFDELMTYLHLMDVVGLDDESGRWYFYRKDVLFADHVLERLKYRSA